MEESVFSSAGRARVFRRAGGRPFGIFGLGLVVGLERGVGGGNQIRLGLDAVSVVVNNPAAALAKLAVDGLLDFHEFFGSQIWQHGFDFGNRAHGGKDSRECMKRQRRLSDNCGFAASSRLQDFVPKIRVPT